MADIYSKYYGGLRGVDMSSDHTQVAENRLAYAVNMYKDYRSGQGQGIDTIPGFRRRFRATSLNGADVPTPYDEPVFGIHRFMHIQRNEDSAEKLFLHVGNRLIYVPYADVDANTPVWGVFTLGEPVGVEDTELGERRIFKFYFPLPELLAGTHVPYICVHEIWGDVGEPIYLTNNWGQHDAGGQYFEFYSYKLNAGDNIKIRYTLYTEDEICYEGLAEVPSVSFEFNNSLYILDGIHYIRIMPCSYEEDTRMFRVVDAADGGYVPTTYINVIPGGENADGGKQYEARNMLSPYFRETFVADGTACSFSLSEEITAIQEVRVYGSLVDDGDYTVNTATSTVTFNEAPAAPENSDYPEGYAGIEITAEKGWRYYPENSVYDSVDISRCITGCTVAAIFDNRVFLSGNPLCPNRIFWSALNNPFYFPVNNWDDVGSSGTRVRALLAVSDTLMVLKEASVCEGSVYYYTPQITDDNLYPVIYTATAGLAGVGCVGACVNFLDDPVFLSRLGLEAMGQLSIRLERAVEHRSSLVDAKLTNLDLSSAVMCEYQGYLLILADGRIFMADSRQRYADDTGVMQYEWYYLEDIGIWEGQYEEYRYSSYRSPYLFNDDGTSKVSISYCTRCHKDEESCVCGVGGGSFVELSLECSDELAGKVANPPDESGVCQNEVIVDYAKTDVGRFKVEYYVLEELSPYDDTVISRRALLCERTGAYIGGTFFPASSMSVCYDNVYFGTPNGVVCSFNFDKRNEDGEIPEEYYTFDGRAIFSGCATKMDCCGIPHLTKNTVKKSTVIKTRLMQSSGLKVKVRTNRSPFNQIARISTRRFSFDDVDFSDFSFVVSGDTLFAVREKEKKWVEKQYFVYSDEFMKPFSLFYIAYRYQIAGRYKDTK